ncbi:hypothetical protein BDF20DRAFT_202519 [Mycotypha africana]|uniref:uncharacterized protein n=1 Tax=Mycotypha africana TaxID=64632 RepID=UPI0023018303|nr:uncharacterized protein BDF20DRAFT_202519 [Mycotypha africana]KAI8967993.1 hypothetical protein BDF20DRAFT_202519 [Mycotypha africana]
MSTEYGTVNQQQHQQHDEETPLISTETPTESCRQKFMRITHKHRFRIISAWIIVLAITAVLTVSFYYAYKHGHTPPHIPEDPPKDVLYDTTCVSDRSWFVALLLSIFFGPLGVDRFYLGYIFLGLLKLITAGLGGIWWTIDVILIALNVLNDHPNGCHLR